MEVYIDDMLVKSTTAELHIAHLAEAFQILKEYIMKLNPAKCAFGVSAEKFLGFIVNNRGIEANPDKIKAVLDMPSPSSIKEVQRLTGRIAALSCFVSKASDVTPRNLYRYKLGKIIMTGICIGISYGK